jgi:hypothetical protein
LLEIYQGLCRRQNTCKINHRGYGEHGGRTQGKSIQVVQDQVLSVTYTDYFGGSTAFG